MDHTFPLCFCTLHLPGSCKNISDHLEDHSQITHGSCLGSRQNERVQADHASDHAKMREFRLEKKSEADFRTCLIRQVRNQTRIFWTGGGDGMRCHAMDHAKMKEFRLEKRSEVGRLTACDVMSCHACHVHVMSCPCHVM